MSERKPGWYWVRVDADAYKWACAYWCGEHLWIEGGAYEIGPRIPAPDEKGDTVTMPRALYELLYAKRDTIDRHYQRESIPPFTWPPKL